MDNILNFKIKNEEVLKQENIKSFSPNHLDKKTIDDSDLFEDISLDDLLEKQKNLKDEIEKTISSKVVSNLKPVFDDDLIKALDVFYDFMKEFDESLQPYYKRNSDNTFDVNMQAYIDAREFLLNEFAIDPGNLDKIAGDDGIVNTNKIYLEGGYSVDASGIIRYYDDIVMNPYKNPTIKIINFKEEILIVDPGVIVDISPFKDTIYKALYVDNPYIDKGKKTIIPTIITADISLSDFEDITGLSIKDNIIASATYTPKGSTDDSDGNYDLSYCNWGSINYFYLMFLVLMGGGQSGVSPLPADENGSVYWNCRGNEGGRSINTGHPWMYSPSRQIGLSRSIIQTLYSNLEVVFKANISWHVKILKHKIGFSFCIGGWLEWGIMLLQSWFSEELKKIKCKAAKETVDITGKKGVNLKAIDVQKQSGVQANDTFNNIKTE